jgi:hypothetical protein
VVSRAFRRRTRWAIVDELYDFLLSAEHACHHLCARLRSNQALLCATPQMHTRPTTPMATIAPVMPSMSSSRYHLMSRGIIAKTQHSLSAHPTPSAQVLLSLRGHQGGRHTPLPLVPLRFSRHSIRRSILAEQPLCGVSHAFVVIWTWW